MTQAYTPRSYQQAGVAAALEQPAYYWAWRMGAGKSVAAMTYADEVLFNHLESGPVLIVAPLKTCETTWVSEPAKWRHVQHLRVSSVLGDAKRRRAALAKQADLYVINRENIAWLVKEYGKRWPFKVVVWDEASGLKDKGTQRWRAMKAVRPYISRLLLLSGTPGDDPMDLWSQMYLIDPEILGRTITGFRETYFVPDKRNRQQIYTWKPKPGAEREIHARCQPYMMSLDEKDWPDMPQRIDMDVPVVLPERARLRYRDLARDLCLPEVTASTAAVLSGKLRQIASGRCYGDDQQVEHFHDEKMDALEDILEQAEGPVLVFYEYQHTKDELVRRFGFETRLDMAKLPRRLALHPASAGHGVDGLQHWGSIVVWVDLPWSLEFWLQANARLDRPGQQQPVRVIRLVGKDTVDEDVIAALGRKEMDQDRLMDAIRRRVGNGTNT